MRSFNYEALPGLVTFGSGKVSELSSLIERVGGTRALLVSTPGQADAAARITSGAGSLIVSRFGGAAMHTPVDVTERALIALKEAEADCVVSYGGGSAIGLGKALAVRTDVPQVVIATTYSGSEMTSVLGETVGGIKSTRKSAAIQPEAVIYDVDLTLALPQSVSGTSGINAIAHAVEGLYARDGNPVMSLLAEEGIRNLANALPTIAADASDATARSDALYGAWLCGMVLGGTGMALHHKLCHVLGGAYNLPHAETHTIILPYVVAFNAVAAPAMIDALKRSLGEEPVRALWNLGRKVGAPDKLMDLGMPEEGIEKCTEIALSQPYWNPRAIEREAIRALIAQAYHGERPF